MDKLKLDIQKFALDPPMAGNIIDEVCLHRYHQNIKRDYVQKVELDMMDDTSGSNWQDMMKNKLDYCVNNINTTKTNYETFINGGWSGVNFGFGIFSKIGDTYQLVWFSSNAIYYCRKLGDGTYQYTNITGVSTGTATIDTSYINSASTNSWERQGRVVSYHFTMKTKGTWNYTTQFLSGLPKPMAYLRFIGLDTSNNSPMRFQIDTNGNVSNAWSTNSPTEGHIIEGDVCYITSE